MISASAMNVFVFMIFELYICILFVCRKQIYKGISDYDYSLGINLFGFRNIQYSVIHTMEADIPAFILHLEQYDTFRVSDLIEEGRERFSGEFCFLNSSISINSSWLLALRESSNAMSMSE